MPIGMIKEGNVTYEGFDGMQLARARFAWNQSQRAAEMAYNAVKFFDRPGNSSLISTWFGLDPSSSPAHAHKLMVVMSQLEEMRIAFVGRPVTLVYRPQLMDRHTYGYVWQHQAGSGMRVVLGRMFMNDPDLQESTQTIYHEITHKVLRTEDHCYGTDLCRQLAQTDYNLATTNADNFGYFAKAMVGKVD